MVEIDSGAVPALLIVRVKVLVLPTTVAGKLRLLGVVSSQGASAVPVSVIGGGFTLVVPAEATTVIEAVRVGWNGETVVGVKVTLIVQLAPTAIPDPQVLMTPKSAAFAPDGVIPPKVRAVPLLFVTVIGIVALEVPTV
jgi:hypothetical protein